MKLLDNQELLEALESLKEGMVDFLEASDEAYTKEDVDQCLKIIIGHLKRIELTSSRMEAMPIVRETVLALNALNKSCSFILIETDQREAIAEILIRAGNLMGYNAIDEDITLEWREW